MRIAKCLVVILALTTTLFGAGEEPSKTRDASCIVRITADPAIIPLNPQTVRHLILTSGVTGKAARDLLGFGTFDPFLLHEGITIEWLGQSIGPVGPELMLDELRQRGRRRSRSTGQSRDEGRDEMMEQLREIYGDRYVGRSSSKDSADKKDDDQPDSGGMGGMMGGGGMYGAPIPGTSAPGAQHSAVGGMGGGMYGAPLPGISAPGAQHSAMGGMYGGMMGGGMYGAPFPTASPPAAQQSAMLRLSVRLPENVKSVAEEFLAALVENLKEALQSGYERHITELGNLADFAESRRLDAQENLEIAMGVHSPDHLRIQKQLDTIVDLSMLTPEMPFSEAIGYLRDAVDPPLQIIVLWKELLDQFEIEPTTPIDMDGLPTVRLGTALKTLLQAVGGGSANLSHQIDGDVIVVREEKAQTPQPAPSGPSAETDLRELSDLRRALARDLRRLEMDLATTEARQRAIQEQIAQIQAKASRKVERDAITQEMQSLVEISEKHLETLTRQVSAGRLSEVELIKARESLTRARIELARRREELGSLAGGAQLNEFNSELSQIAIDSAAKRAEMELLRRQLTETEAKVARASTFNPEAARIHIARQTLDIAEAQVIQLKRLLTGLQPPTVTVIGAN